MPTEPMPPEPANGAGPTEPDEDAVLAELPGDEGQDDAEADR
jgi:hypothetical protein